MHRIVLAALLLLAPVLANCSHDDSAYLQRLTFAETIISTGEYLPNKMTGYFRAAWASSIRGGLDFNAGLARVKDAMQKEDWFAMLERQRADAKKAMSAIAETPVRYHDAHEKLVEMYGLYERLCSLAASPEGSLQSYSSECSAITSKLEILESQFNVLVPQHP